MGNNPVLTVFVIVAACALVLQSIALLAFAIGAGAALKKIVALMDEMKGYAAPVLVSSREILHDAAPKVKKITSNLEQISDVVTDQTVHLNAVVDDVLRRSQAHINHADAIIGETLDTVEQTRASVTHVVEKPLKWAMAMANGVATGVQQFFRRDAHREEPENGVSNADRPWEPDTERLKRVYRTWAPNPEDLDN
jgi:hypothetical protein